MMWRREHGSDRDVEVGWVDNRMLDYTAQAASIHAAFRHHSIEHSS